MTLKSPMWVDGWLRPFKELVFSSLPPKPSPVLLPDILNSAFESLQRSSTDGVAGSIGFQKFLTNISNYLRTSDPPVNLSEKLRIFSVPAGTSFSAYALQLFKLLESIRNSDGTPQSVNLSFVMDCVRKSIFYQYPTKIQELFPDERRSCELPYSSIDELRKHFERHMPDSVKSLERTSTNNQPGNNTQPDGSTTTKPKGSNSPGRKGKNKKTPPNSPGKVTSVQAYPFS